MTFDTTPATIDAGGGSATAQVTAQPECTWSVSTDVSWISPAASSGQGTAPLQFSVAANPDPVTRQGNLTVNDSALHVSQAPMSCSFDVTPRTITLTRAGGSASITVTANGNCSWTSTAPASWLNVVTPPNASGNGTVTVSAPANTGLVRIGSVTVAGVPVVVSQEAATPANCQATLEPPAITLPSAAGASPPIAVQIPTGCSWTSQSSTPWIAIASGAGGDASGSVTLSLAANAGAERAGVVSIAGQILTVTQSAAPCSFSVSPTSLSAASAGATLSPVTVATGPACTWSSSSGASWLSFTASAPVTGSGSVQIVAAQNPGAARNGTVTIAGTQVTVNQSALVCSYSLTPGSQTIGVSGGAGNSFTVTTDGACSWTASTTDGWITITQNATGPGTGTVTFSVAANTGAARSGSISVQGQTFTVNQAAAPAPCTYQVNPTSHAAAAGGGSGPDIAVTAGSGCDWTPSTTDNWITITGGAGPGNGTVTFSVAANTGPSRSGSISIHGTPFNITQASGCTYQIAPLSQSPTAAGGAGTDITVTTGTGCTWTATTTDSWITITSGAAPGPVNFTVAANTGPARTGHIAIDTQSVTIDQADGCTFQLTPTSATIAGASGSGGSVDVTTAQGCAWTASSTTTAWLAITAGHSGSGPGTVTYSATSDNTAAGHATRSGSLTIANITFNVTQENVNP